MNKELKEIFPDCGDNSGFDLNLSGVERRRIAKLFGQDFLLISVDDQTKVYELLKNEGLPCNLYSISDIRINLKHLTNYSLGLQTAYISWDRPKPMEDLKTMLRNQDIELVVKGDHEIELRGCTAQFVKFNDEFWIGIEVANTYNISKAFDAIGLDAGYTIGGVTINISNADYAKINKGVVYLDWKLDTKD